MKITGFETLLLSLNKCYKTKILKLKALSRYHFFFVLLLVAFFYSYKPLLAQEYKVTSDIGLWTEISITKSFLKDFSVNVSQQFRLNEDFSEPDDWISEIGLGYKINKNFALEANGRYTKNYKYSEPTQNDYRYNFDLRYDGKLSSDFKLYYRLRYQKEFYGNSVGNQFLHYYETAFRHRIKLGWIKNKPHTIYSSVEIFRLTKKTREPFYSKYRLWLGDDFKLNPGKLDAALGIEHQLNDENPYTYYLLKLKYSFSF